MLTENVMRMRTGRLSAGYFARGIDPDFMAGERLDLFHGHTNTAWFSVDTETGVATEIGFRDFYASTAVIMMGYLEGDEAVAVVSERDMLRWSDERTENQSAWGTRTVVLSTEEVARLASFLVTRGKIYALNGVAGKPDPRVEYVRPDDVTALFADA